jgi:hypothetical protein
MFYPPTDPPFEPFPETVRWYHTSPMPLQGNLDLAVLIVRVGLATNALAAQIDAGATANGRSGARQMRNLIASFVTSSAFANEAIRLAGGEMQTLRALAERIGIRPEVLKEIGQLCAGKHPASGSLKRARNQFGFHWDKDEVEASVREYGRNELLIWLEFNSEGDSVHRLAAEVLAHALFPNGAAVGDDEGRRQEIVGEMKQVHGAILLIIEFFEACTYGYFLFCGAKRKVRKADLGTPAAEDLAGPS